MAKLEFEFLKDNTAGDHQALFRTQINTKCPQYKDNIDKCLLDGIEVHKMEFYTYALFEDFNINNPHFKSFADFEKIANTRKPELDYVFSFTNTISFKFENNRTTQIAYAGCGGALTTANKLFDLIYADYIRIPEKPGRPRKGVAAGQNKTLDFEYVASDGNRLLRVECKGKEGFDGSIQSKVTDILEKKEAQPSGIRDLSFGIISIFPVEPTTQSAKCILIDPEIPDFEQDPASFKLTVRLLYYANRLGYLGNTWWLREIRELFLSEENGDIMSSGSLVQKEVEDTEVLLVNYIGLDDSKSFTKGYHFKLSILSEVSGETVFTRVTQIGENEYLLYGFLGKVLDLFQYASVGEFLNFKVQKRVVPWDDSLYVWDGETGKKEIWMRGDLFINDTGEVLGILKEVEDEYSSQYESSEQS